MEKQKHLKWLRNDRELRLIERFGGGITWPLAIGLWLKANSQKLKAKSQN